MRILTLIIILLILFNGCKRNEHNSTVGSKAMLTKDEIINIATKVVVSQGFPIDSMDIYYDIENMEWEKTLLNLSKEDRNFAKQYTKELSGRSYQAVRYRPDITKIMSGDFWVFVDNKSGKVITFCGGL